MKHRKSLLIHMIPLVLVAVATALICLTLYSTVIAEAREDSWNQLTLSADNIANRIYIRIVDNLNLLHYVSDAIVLKNDIGERDKILEYLNSLQSSPGTMFSRIDIMTPDGRVMTQDKTVETDSSYSFEELKSRGSYISSRYQDPYTGKEAIYCVTPIKEEDEVVGLLFGMIECSLLEEEFKAKTYGGKATVFLIDDDNGDYLMDAWHGSLGNVYQMDDWEVFEGYEGLSFQEDIAGGQSGTVAAISKTNGKGAYAAYSPVPGFNWTVMVMAQGEQVYEHLNTLRRTLLVAGISIGILLVAYFIWNIAVISHSVKNAERAQLAELERMQNEAKSQFLTAMSHDIRTPMNAIIGMTTLATKHKDDPEYVQSCLAKVTLASNHLLMLINDVLDISKVESGKMTLNPVAFSLADTVTNLLNIVRQQIKEKQQSFDIRVGGLLHEEVFADQLRLNQIMINILSNAVKYTPEGGRITVDIREEPLPDRPDAMRLVYVVADNGVGMSEEFQKTMYSSFTRERANIGKTIQGSGLGLAIVKQMVDLMEGSIECQSAVGVGTTFTITLDLPVASQLMEDCILPPMEVLLVDDDEIFLETAAQTLQDLGVQPTCVASGEEGLRTVVQRHESGSDYPVVIIDYKMPGMDGIETTRAIRAQVGQRVPIIVISAYEAEEIEKAALAAGANGFISKPFFRSSVYRDMTQILGLGAEQTPDHEVKHVCLEGMRILVAEDNDLNWEIAHEILAMYGVTTVRAENGQICLELLHSAAEGSFDLVLMDIQMPVMNGYDATIAIRSSEQDWVRNIPVIAMTADAYAEDIQRCWDVGMNGHITKPIDVDRLLEVIRERGGQSPSFVD